LILVLHSLAEPLHRCRPDRKAPQHAPPCTSGRARRRRSHLLPRADAQPRSHQWPDHQGEPAGIHGFRRLTTGSGR